MYFLKIGISLHEHYKRAQIKDLATLLFNSIQIAKTTIYRDLGHFLYLKQRANSQINNSDVNQFHKLNNSYLEHNFHVICTPCATQCSMRIDNINLANISI